MLSKQPVGMWKASTGFCGIPTGATVCANFKCANYGFFCILYLKHNLYQYILIDSVYVDYITSRERTKIPCVYPHILLLSFANAVKNCCSETVEHPLSLVSVY